MALNDNKPILQKASNSEEFYFTFLNLFKEQLKIKSIHDINVLTYMCLNMDYNSTTVKLTSNSREHLCKAIGIKNTHLSNSLKRLIDLGLIRGEKGEYEMNPFLVWRGKLNERDRLLATKGIEIRLLFKATSPEIPYNPMNGGSKEFEK